MVFKPAVLCCGGDIRGVGADGVPWCYRGCWCWWCRWCPHCCHRCGSAAPVAVVATIVVVVVVVVHLLQPSSCPRCYRRCCCSCRCRTPTAAVAAVVEVGVVMHPLPSGTLCHCRRPLLRGWKGKKAAGAHLRCHPSPHHHSTHGPGRGHGCGRHCS